MIKVITAYNDKYKDIAAINNPIIANYCSYHCYDYESYYIPNDFSRPPAWAKIQFLINNCLENNYKYLFWIDTDTVILNPYFDIVDYILPDKYIYISKDMYAMNTGVLFLRNNQFCLDLLYKIWEMEEFIHYQLWEQAAFISLVEQNWNNIQDYIYFIPSKKYNAYIEPITTDPDYIADKSTFVLHLAGSPMEFRYLKIQKFASEYSYIYKSKHNKNHGMVYEKFITHWTRLKKIALCYNDHKILDLVDIMLFRHNQNMRTE